MVIYLIDPKNLLTTLKLVSLVYIIINNMGYKIIAGISDKQMKQPNHLKETIVSNSMASVFITLIK